MVRRVQPLWTMRIRGTVKHAFRRRFGALLVAVAASWALGAHSAHAQPARVTAHWHEASQILVHQPGEEVFLGLLHPVAALFADTFSLEGAASEHRQFVATLKSRGVRAAPR